jgi:predicted aspartyl protease
MSTDNSSHSDFSVVNAIETAGENQRPMISVVGKISKETKGLDGLVDTGSYITLVKSGLFKDLKTKNSGARTICNNKQILIKEVLTDTCVSYESQNLEVKIYTCEEMSQDMILGADWCKLNQAVIDFGTGKIMPKKIKKIKILKILWTN